MSESHAELVAALLEQESFIRQLARGLLAREDQVEDVLQETWIAALRRPPREVGRLRGWLAAVVSNLARRVHRDEARRRKREERGAQPESVPPERELLERLALQKRIIDEVARLPETDRIVLLLRFTEGLSSEKIGERTGLNPSTVRTRVQRTLERLRHRLDEGESSGTWRALLAPLALGTVPRPLVPISRASAAGALGIGAGIMSMLKSLGVVASIVLVGALWWMLDSRSEAERPPGDRPVAGEPVAEGSLEPKAPGDSELPVLREVELEEDQSSEEPPPPKDPSSSTWTARVLVFDAEGRPVSGARVECWTTSRAHEHEPPDEVGWSDGAGRAAFEIAVDLTVIRAEHPQWGTSGVTALKRSGPKEARLELLPRAHIMGTVSWADGSPARGVEVEYPIRGEPMHRFVLVSGEPIFTDAEGKFQLDVESGPEYALRAIDGDRYSPFVEIAPEPGGSEEVHLQFPGRFRLGGTLLDPFDHPFPEGRVFAWRVEDGDSFPDVCGSVPSDDRGRFEMPLTEPGELVLIGIGSDHGRSVPIRVMVTAEDPEARVDLKLASTGSIFGRVSSPEGEGIAARIVATPERIESTGPDSRGFFPPQRETADADGQFVLEGLHPEQSYRVEVWPKAKERERKLVRRGVRVGGGPLIVVVTEEELRGSVLEGRVLDAMTGLPVPSFEVLLAQERSPGRWTFATSPEPYRDEEGRFALEGLVAGDRYSLLVQSPDHGGHVIDPFTLEDDQELQVRLKRIGSLDVRVVEAGGSPAANARVEVVRIAELPLAEDPPGARTDVTGHHLFERVPAARYWVSAIRGETRSDPVEVEVDGPTRIELRLPE